jgi:hypothetical protein
LEKFTGSLVVRPFEHLGYENHCKGERLMLRSKNMTWDLTGLRVVKATSSCTEITRNSGPFVSVLLEQARLLWRALDVFASLNAFVVSVLCLMIAFEPIPVSGQSRESAEQFQVGIPSSPASAAIPFDSWANARLFKTASTNDDIVTIPASMATGIGLASAATFQILHESNWKDYEDVVILAALNFVAKQAANTGQMMETADYNAIATQARSWLDSKAPQVPVFDDQAAVFRYTIDSLISILNTSTVPQTLASVLDSLQNVKLVALEITLNPGRQYPGDYALTAASGRAFQFIADTVEDASDLAHNDAKYAAAINPVLADFLNTDSNASFTEVQDLFPNALPVLSTNSDGSVTARVQDLLVRYQSLVNDVASVTDAHLASIKSQSGSLSSGTSRPIDSRLHPLGTPATTSCKVQASTSSNGSIVITLDACTNNPGKPSDYWANVQTAVTVFSKVAGFADPQLGSQISSIGGAVIQGGKAIAQIDQILSAGSAFSSLTSALGLLNPIGSLVGAGYTIFSSLFGRKSSANSEILAGIQKLSQQIAQLQQDMDQQFAIVDSMLNVILNTMNQDFALINYQLGVLNGEIQAIQAGLLDVQTQLNLMGTYSTTYAQTSEYESLVQFFNGCLNYYTLHNGGDIGQQGYNTCENAFYSAATSLASDQIWAGLASPPYGDGSLYNLFLSNAVTGVCSGCVSPFDTLVNFLANYPAANLNLPALANTRLANPAILILTARAYLELATEWPQYASKINSSRLNDVIQQLLNLQQAIRSANTTNSAGSINPNSAILTKVTDKYNAAISNLQAGMRGDVDSYLTNPINGITSSNGISLDPFAGGANQHPSWRPSINSISFCNTGLVGNAPSNLLKSVPDIYAFSQGYLSSGQLSMCVSQVQWVNLHTPNASEPYTIAPPAAYGATGPLFGPPWCPNPCGTATTVGALSAGINVSFNSTVIMTASVTSSPIAQAIKISGCAGICVSFAGSMNANTGLVAEWTSGANIFTQFNGSAQIAQQSQPQLVASIAAQVDALARKHQQNIYSKIASDFLTVSPVQSAGQLLTAFKLLEQAYASFGLPKKLQTSDPLRAILFGSQSIVDASAVQAHFASFSASPIPDTSVNRIDTEIASLRSRSSTLAATLDAVFGQIQQSKVPDISYDIDTTFRDLQAFAALKDADAVSQCTYQISVPFTVLSEVGGTVSVGVQTPNGCAFKPTTSASWIGISPGQGFGNASVKLSVSPNTTGAARTATVIIGDQLVRIIQDVDAVAMTQNSAVFAIPNRGGTSLASGGTGSFSVGYGSVKPDSGSTTPSGLAIITFRQHDILVSETAVPAAAPLYSACIYAEIKGPVDTGLAIANPNNSGSTINFFFTDQSGNVLGSGTTTVAANSQLARFLDQPPFNMLPPFQGTFSFTSTVPVGVTALRGLTNERDEFLMSTLPVIDTAAAPANGMQVIPHYVDGGGWSTQIVLVNPTNVPMTGGLQFSKPDGTAANLTIAGQTNASVAYSIAAHSSQKFSTVGAATTTSTGAVRVIPNMGTAPTPLAIFSYRPGKITISEAGVSVTSGTALRMYVESSGATGQPGNIQSGIAIANASSSMTTVIFELTQLDGSAVLSPVSISLPAFGQTSKLLADLFPALPNSFKGVLRITTASSISMIGLRVRYNERADFLMSATPPIVENPSVSDEMLFPQLADGGGFTTQFILYSRTGQAASGILRFLKQDGSPLNLSLN